MQNERTIKALMNNAQPWIFCESKEVGEQFLKDAEAEGFKFGDGMKPTEKEWWYVIVAHSDGTLGYQSMTNWVVGFNINEVVVGNKTMKIAKVDYKKYKSGEEDYICKTPGATGCIKVKVQ